MDLMKYANSVNMFSKIIDKKLIFSYPIIRGDENTMNNRQVIEKSKRNHKHRRRAVVSLKTYAFSVAIATLLGFGMGKHIYGTNSTPTEVISEINDDLGYVPEYSVPISNDPFVNKAYEERLEAEALQKSREEGEIYKAKEAEERQKLVEEFERFNEEYNLEQQRQMEQHMEDVRNGRGL